MNTVVDANCRGRRTWFVFRSFLLLLLFVFTGARAHTHTHIDIGAYTIFNTSIHTRTYAQKHGNGLRRVPVTHAAVYERRDVPRRVLCDDERFDVGEHETPGKPAGLLQVRVELFRATLAETGKNWLVQRQDGRFFSVFAICPIPVVAMPSLFLCPPSRSLGPFESIFVNAHEFRALAVVLVSYRIVCNKNSHTHTHGEYFLSAKYYYIFVFIVSAQSYFLLLLSGPSAKDSILKPRILYITRAIHENRRFIVPLPASNF